MSTLEPGAPTPLDLTSRVEPSLQFHCPRCEEVFELLAVDVPATGYELRCPGCELDFGSRLVAPRPEQPLTRCWLCQAEELYSQRDINKQLALGVVTISASVGLLMTLLIDPLLGFSCLVLMAVAFALFHGLLSRCIVCYICGSVYRGFPPAPGLSGHCASTEVRLGDRREAWLREALRAGDRGQSDSASP